MTCHYLIHILKQNLVHGVTRDTVSEHQYISHAYWNGILYMDWQVIQFQNICISHTYIVIEYCTWSDISYSFRTLVYLTCILNRILYMEWYVIQFEIEYFKWSDMWYSFRTSVYLTCMLNRILYMEWHVIQFQNISISHMHTEAEYCTWSDMGYSFRTSVKRPYGCGLYGKTFSGRRI